MLLKNLTEIPFNFVFHLENAKLSVFRVRWCNVLTHAYECIVHLLEACIA